MIHPTPLSPPDARYRLYLVAYSLEELARATEVATESGVTNTLELLSQCMLEALTVIHPFVPEPPQDLRPRTE